MTPAEEGRFQPRPRKQPSSQHSHDSENFRTELQRILQRTEVVAAAGRDNFADGDPSYDIASMVIIRLAALLERSEFSASAAMLSDDELAAIRTTRNIAAHAGYGSMNDDLFWAAVTIRVPVIVTRLLGK